MSVIDKFTERFGKDKKLRTAVIILLIAAAVLLMLSEIIKTASENAKTGSFSEYTQQLEHKVSDLLSRVDGVGRIKVVITLQTNAGLNTSAVTTAAEPGIRGVVILCDGGDDIKTVAKITEIVSAALNIGYNQIYITKMSSE